MEKPDALKHFRGENRYNCAQAIVKAYASLVALEEGCLERFSGMGSGRAPDGECGALYAAKSIFQEPDAKRQIEAVFVQAAGSKRCKEIRKSRSLSCAQCVQTAAEAVFLQLGNGRALQRPTDDIC